MGGVPSVPTDPSRRVEVIAAGYSRTGTVSMSLALERLLDGPAMHGGTQLFGREDAYSRLWARIFQARSAGDPRVVRKLLAEATAGFAAVADNPAIMFLPELLDLYPGAKVVLVERDPDAWARSMGDMTRHFALPGWALRVLLAPLPGWRWAPDWLEGMGKAETDRFGPDWSPQRILHWNAFVRSQVPPENLLVTTLPAGWPPLAAFLGVPAPDPDAEPFPRANDGEAVRALARRVFAAALAAWGGILAGAGVVGWGAWRAWAARS